jgi:hypothetical protein
MLKRSWKASMNSQQLRAAQRAHSALKHLCGKKPTLAAE